VLNASQTMGMPNQRAAASTTTPSIAVNIFRRLLGFWSVMLGHLIFSATATPRAEWFIHAGVQVLGTTPIDDFMIVHDDSSFGTQADREHANFIGR
jgi:hypothetical protein